MLYKTLHVDVFVPLHVSFVYQGVMGCLFYIKCDAVTAEHIRLSVAFVYAEPAVREPVRMFAGEA